MQVYLGDMPAMLQNSGPRRECLCALTSDRADDIGGAEGAEAGHEGDTDADLGGPAVGASRDDARAEGLQAAHLRFDPDSDMASGPPLPERQVFVPRSARDFVSGACCWAVLFD